MADRRGAERDPAGTDGPQHRPGGDGGRTAGHGQRRRPCCWCWRRIAIRDADQFRQAINAGRKPAKLVVCLRHRADSPGNYGYIEASEPFSLGGPAHVPIKRFVEKPDQSQRSNSRHRPSPGTAACSCSAPAPCWPNWSDWPRW